MYPDYKIPSVIKGKQSGFGLPAAVFVVTTLALIIAVMAELQQRSGDFTALQALSQRAFYSAESGSQLALNLLLPVDGSTGQSCATVPFYRYSFSANGLSGCRVDVSCRDIADGAVTYYVLTSIGSCDSGNDSARRKVEVMVQ